MKTRRLLAVLVSLLCFFPLTVFPQKQSCPEFSGTAKTRIEGRARWLVSESLRQQVTRKSKPLGQLIAFEQCHVLVSGVISDDFAKMEGPYFSAEGVPLKSAIAEDRHTWMMAVAPIEASGKVPDPNVLEITEHDWTLFYCGERGKKTAAASGKY